MRNIISYAACECFSSTWNRDYQMGIYNYKIGNINFCRTQ